MKRIALLLLVVGLMLGCGERTIVGTWTAPEIKFAKTVFEFEPDGSVRSELRGPDGLATITTGKWTYEGNTLTVQWEFVDYENTPADLRADLEADFRKSKETPAKGAVEWLGRSEVIWHLPTGATKLKRS